MGFETSKRIRRKYGNEPCQAIINSAWCKFDSKLEYRWAQYLEILRKAGEIKTWTRQCDTFKFPKEKCNPKQYTPDFQVWRGKSTAGEIHECKGYFSGTDRSKFRKMKKYYPQYPITLVMTHKIKNANHRRITEKYVDRIIENANTIFKQCGIK